MHVKAEIILNYNNGYRWYERRTIKAKGWVFDELGRSFQCEDLVDYFEGIESVEGLSNLLCRTNGHFAVIVNTENGLIAATDRGRSIPLYYRVGENDVRISDSGFSLIDDESFDSPLNEFALQEYLAAGHVTGNKTLLNDVFQMGAGEILFFSEKGVVVSEYFKFLPNSSESCSFDASSNRFVEILEYDFKNLIKGLDGRTVVIPLSGGYDSRSIASMFRRLNYSNVICYSFGQQGSPEMVISQEVAQSLGYRWLFIETTHEMVCRFAESEEFLKYVDFAANAGSFYIIQDFFAVRKIKGEGLVPDDSVFMPGHSGDTLGGSNFLELFTGHENIDEMIEKVIKHRFNLNSIKRENVELIRKELNDRYDNRFNPALWFDYWCMKEWNPKMFANGVRVYEYFGYCYFLPLWSKNLLEFFSNLPFEYRLGKELYEFTLESKIFEPLGVNLSPERRKAFGSEASLFQKMKNIVKRLLPKSFIYRNFSYDPINAKLYTHELAESMKRKGVMINYIGTNSVKVQWYARFLELKYKGKGNL